MKIKMLFPALLAITPLLSSCQSAETKPAQESSIHGKTGVSIQSENTSRITPDRRVNN